MKRSQVNLLIGVILVLIATFLLFLFFSRFENVAKGLRMDFGCTLRVIGSERAKFFGADVLPALCKPDFNVLASSEISKEYLPFDIKSKLMKKSDEFKEMFNVEDDSQLIQKAALLYKVALEIRKCWYKMGSGRFNLFGEWPLINQRFCEVCAINVPLGFSIQNFTYQDLYNFIYHFKKDDKYINDVYEIINSPYNVYLDEFHLKCKDHAEIKGKTYSHEVKLDSNFYVVFMKHNLNYLIKKVRFVYYGLQDLISKMGAMTFVDDWMRNLKKRLNENKLKMSLYYLIQRFKTFNNDIDVCQTQLDELQKSLDGLIEYNFREDDKFGEKDKEKYDEIKTNFEKELSGFENTNCVGHIFLTSLFRDLLFGSESERENAMLVLLLYEDKSNKRILQELIERFRKLEDSINNIDLNEIKNEKLLELIDEYRTQLFVLKAKCERVKSENELSELNCDDFTMVNKLASLSLINKLVISEERDGKSAYRISFKDIDFNKNNENSFYLIIDNFDDVGTGKSKIQVFWMPLFELEYYYKSMILALWNNRREYEECNLLKKQNEIKTNILLRKNGYLSGLVIGNKETLADVCDYFIVP